MQFTTYWEAMCKPHHYREGKVLFLSILCSSILKKRNSVKAVKLSKSESYVQ